MMREGGKVSQRPHKPHKAGSIPAPVTTSENDDAIPVQEEVHEEVR